MARSELNTTTFDHESIKQSLVDFLKSTDEFGDFDYDGSAINTIVDLLTRNTTYSAYLANMLANESFIESAQLRSSVVSHAQKLSYVPKSETAARLVCDIEVTPSDTVGIPNSIVMDSGSTFLSSIDGTTYTFTNISSSVLTFNATRGTYKTSGITLYQGQLLNNKFVHSFGDKHTIPNQSCDRSTLSITSSETSGSSSSRTYVKALAINELADGEAVYFLSEDSQGRTEISFGRDILGDEPIDDTIITATYVSVESEHANGISTLVAGSTIEGNSNILVTVTTPSYGGTEREDIERIRFIAPKYYQAQGRALTDSDYIPILKAGFPFVNSAISWGGETNVPPVYGTVFISILSSDGGQITNAVKQQMVTYLGDRNVGSVTPTIVDPDVFGINLMIAFAYDETLTSKTFNELSAEITQVIEDYNEELFDFGQFYNEAELNRRIKNINGIITMDIDKRQFKDLTVLRFDDPVYTANFNNPLEPGFVKMENFQISSTGTNHLMYDEDGILFVSYTAVGGEQIVTEVGTVDYDNGIVDFSINMIQEEDTVMLEVHTLEDNFYVEQNQVVYIDNIDLSILDIRTRQGVRLS